jgi:hypothetical protein
MANPSLTRSFHPAAAMLLVLSLIALGASIAVAHGGDESLIHSCVAKNGSIRIVGANSTCRRNERPLDWSKGDSSFMLREAFREITLGPGDTDSVASVCEPGEAATGGGMTNLPGEVFSGQVSVVSDGPVFDGVSSGWYVLFRNETEETVTIAPGVSSVCVRGTMTAQ